MTRTVAINGSINKVTEETKADGSKVKVSESQANEKSEVLKHTETTDKDGKKETKVETVDPSSTKKTEKKVETFKTVEEIQDAMKNFVPEKGTDARNLYDQKEAARKA